MRLLVVTHYFSSHRGGVEIVAEQLAREWLSQDHSVVWLASSTNEAQFPNDGIHRRAVSACNVVEDRLGAPYPIWGLASLPILRAEIRNCDALILHDGQYIGSTLAYFFARVMRKPVLIIQHIGIVPVAKRFLRFAIATIDFLITRRLLRGADQVVFISQNTRREFADLQFRRPPQVIFNGVDTSRFHPPADRSSVRRQLGWPENQIVLLFVGRFVEKKGMLILRSLTLLYPNCLWVLVGWGPIAPETWGQDNVKVISNLSNSDLPPLYQAADLLVLPSIGEGFPLVIQEAMACGLPVLCGDDTRLATSEARDLIMSAPVDPKKPNHTAEQWATALKRLFASGELDLLRPRISSFAAENWSWKTAGQRYLDLLSALLR